MPILLNKYRLPIISECLPLMKDVRDLQSINGLLGWDQEVMMPAGGADYRASQIAVIEKAIYNALTSKEYELLVDKIREDKSEKTIEEKNFLNLFVAENEKAKKLNINLVSKLAIARSQTLEAWKKARAERNAINYLKKLEVLVDLKKEEAEKLGYENEPLDAFLNEYEPKMNCKFAFGLIESISNTCKKLINEIEIVKRGELKSQLTQIEQMKLAKRIAKTTGFDFHHGRLDTSIHPFSSSFAIKDVRITTRVDLQDYTVSMLSLLHELGHGLYEQGVDYCLSRTFAAAGASYALHEAQALYWENHIGRSLDYWLWLQSQIEDILGTNPMGNFAFKTFLYVNNFSTNTLRTDSDELNYHLHIKLRFELERKLFSSEISVYQLPELWNTSSKELLNIDISNDCDGVLQDIHWAFGGFGYFPTYSLGAIYSAGFANFINQNLNVNEVIKNGEFYMIRNLLKNEIYKYGKLFTPLELYKKVCGEEPTVTHFEKYMKEKIQIIEDINRIAK